MSILNKKEGTVQATKNNRFNSIGKKELKLAQATNIGEIDNFSPTNIGFSITMTHGLNPPPSHLGKNL